MHKLQIAIYPCFKFHEKKTINFLTLGVDVFQHTRTIFEMIQDIIITNVLINFHEDWTMNVTFIVLTNIIETNLLTKFHEDGPINVVSRFHEDRTINVASRVLTRKKSVTIFELVQDIIKTNLLIKFHED
ncbi:hypothetical protein DPMN_148323 [Dreissena polymorpha]|uniref:Uncharacterized protein n=1 Tax=Dreissena polymorpha TaxID=45954 RepID=A0A9D4F9K7_DREPO|nr:hypothetical protein DPMN_148323 [Dreissena polymorpha]